MNFRFPFAVNTAGRITASGGDEAMRGKMIQVLFTAPGERVNLPEFGTSLLPNTTDWGPIRFLPPGPAQSDDREPAALVKTNGDVELF
jgi:hypothetical protein